MQTFPHRLTPSQRRAMNLRSAGLYRHRSKPISRADRRAILEERCFQMIADPWRWPLSALQLAYNFPWNSEHRLAVIEAIMLERGMIDRKTVFDRRNPDCKGCFYDRMRFIEESGDHGRSHAHKS